jgi:hypothetical protein
MRILGDAAQKLIGYIEQFGKDLAKEVAHDEILDLVAQLESWEKHRVLHALRRADMAEDEIVYGTVLSSFRKDQRSLVAKELRKIAEELDK